MTWYALLVDGLRLLLAWCVVSVVVTPLILPLDASDDYVSPDDDSPA